MIRAKMKEYLSRAEKLQQFLERRQPVAEGGPAPKKKDKSPGSDGKSGDDKSGDEEEDEEKKKRKDALGDAILREKPNVKWSDVAGLENAKEALKEAVILPVRFPHLFVGKRKPWKGASHHHHHHLPLFLALPFFRFIGQYSLHRDSALWASGDGEIVPCKGCCNRGEQLDVLFDLIECAAEQVAGRV